MGDHTKTGINTMINTGTVFGVGCNIYGSDFPRNFVPSYTWGGASGYKEHMLPQFFKTADAVMKRRGKQACHSLSRRSGASGLLKKKRPTGQVFITISLQCNFSALQKRSIGLNNIIITNRVLVI